MIMVKWLLKSSLVLKNNLSRVCQNLLIRYNQRRCDMKKILLFIVSLFVVFSIYGCSSGYEPTDFPLVTSSIYFNFNQMTFAIGNDRDILYGLENPSDDFIILKEHVLNETLSDTEKQAYKHLINHIVTLSENTSTTIRTILTYDSTTFKDALEALQLEVSLDDIVIFNEIKSLQSEDISSTYISKINYLNQRLQTTLSTDDINHLEDLQTVYLEMKDLDESYQLFEHPLQDMIDLLETYGITYSTEEVTSFSAAYDILYPLY